MPKEFFLNHYEVLAEGVKIDSRGLSAQEIQLAIDMYVTDYGKTKKDNIELNQLVDELLVENRQFRQFREDYHKKYSSGY